MKKFILLMVIVIGIASCNLQMIDNEGWKIFQCGWVIEKNQVLIQSHQGFVLEKEGVQKFHTEIIERLPTKIYNITNSQIDVKITYGGEYAYWQRMEANSILEL